MRTTWTPLPPENRFGPVLSGTRREARGVNRLLAGFTTLLLMPALSVVADTPFEDAGLSGTGEVETLPPGQRLEISPRQTDDLENRLLDPEAAKFDTWKPLADEEMRFHLELPECHPSHWFYDLGFRHSSTHGRNVGRGIPLTHSSWRNRPYHVDWFVGGLLNSSLMRNQVRQNNSSFAGLRAGWDFDHYWGAEWRFGWSNPEIQYANSQEYRNESSDLFLTDLDLTYYPWGDSKIRPYVLLGLGFTRVNFQDEYDIHHGSSLLTMPYGVGLQFPMWPWLTWRLEILDNLAFGADQIETLANVSFTLGMELRLGARPASYWPWRSSRYIW